MPVRQDYVRPGCDRDHPGREPSEEPPRISSVPPKVDQALERRSKRVQSLWVFVIAGFTLIGAGFGASTAIFAWRLEVARASVDAFRADMQQQLREIRVDLRAEETSRNSDRERLTRIEATLGIMPTTEILAIRQANKEKK